MCQSLFCCFYTGYRVYSLQLTLSGMYEYYLDFADEEFEVMRDEAI